MTGAGHIASARMASALSTQPQSVGACEQACDQIVESLGKTPDLAFVFYTGQHAEHARHIGETIARRLSPREVVGVSAGSVIGGGVEVERGPALSILAACLPGVALHTFTSDSLPDLVGDQPDADLWAQAIGAGDQHRATIVFVDPFSVPMTALMPALNGAMDSLAPPKDSFGLRRTRPVLFGGIASAAAKPGGNSLLATERVRRSGIVGVSLSGRIRLDTVVSQGCRPFGPTMIVTKAKANVIFELAGKPAAQAVQEAAETLGDDPRETLKGGVFLGVVIDEYKPRFGRDDYLIRNIVGLDPQKGFVAIADFVRVGQTVRLHTRDAKTADEDLALLLDAQKLYDPPLGSLLITCNGRGERMFKKRNHDAEAVMRAFRPRDPAEEIPTGGTLIDPARENALPQAGFFAAGEIGPVGPESFVHGNTACAALFREA